jgi:hypothetical protein
VDYLDALLSEQTMSIYRVDTPSQLALYEPELRAAAAEIIREADPFGRKSTDDVYRDLLDHAAEPAAAVWVVLDSGRLTGFLSARVFVGDEGRNAAITWAFGRHDRATSQAVLDAFEAWAVAQRCRKAMVTRSTKLGAFGRLMRQYGYGFSYVMYEKKLGEATTAVEANGAPCGPS